jgi:dTDP-4-amino-4,6-dideoxygalactose transaminase
MKYRIPMSSPDITEHEIDAVDAVMRTKQHLSIGPKIVEFEKEIANLVGGGHAIGVNSGTSGLHLAVIAAGAGEGDAVITSPFSFVASANAILYERALPIFLDVEESTGNIDPALMAECVDDLMNGTPNAKRWLPPSHRNEKLPQLKALLPVDVFGQPADFDRIDPIAQRWSLPVIEDSCEAIAAEYSGRPAGTLGDCGVFAFYPNKQMTTGEGGVLVTRRDDWAEVFRSLRNQGRDEHGTWLNHVRLGYNYRMDELSAALGVAQLQRLPELFEKRARVAAWYEERLAAAELIDTPQIAATTTRMSWFVYVVRIQPPASRDAVMSRLEDEGIPSRPYFTPIHVQPFYTNAFGYKPGDFPVTEKLGDISLALPFSGVMTEEQVDLVCEKLIAAVQATAGTGARA